MSDAQKPLSNTTLPSDFAVCVERRPDGWWLVTAPAVHVGLFIIHRDLSVALADVPAALSELLRLDGPVPRGGDQR